MAAPMVSIKNMLILSSFIFCVLSLILCAQVAGDEDYYDALSSLVIEHSFDSGPNPVYTKRGLVSIHSITSNNAVIDQEESHTEEDIDKLRSLVKANGMYRIRVLSRPATSTSPAQYVHSYTPACGLYESGLSDQLEIHLDGSGSLIGASVVSLLPHCTGVHPSAKDLRYFKTSVELVQTFPGPVPETQAYIQKMEQDKMEKAKGNQGENKSFLGKYWMYIVPAVIIMMFVSSVDPNQGGGGGGGR